jgi:3-oxoacyl-[acyl-carrier protein] reductase
MNRLKDKVAIITGGASGIGKATVIRFLEEGAYVALWDIDKARAEALAGSLNGLSDHMRVYAVNTTDLASCEQAAKEVYEAFGRIDILVNNAGITRDATMRKITAEQWDQVISVNLTGVFNCTKAVHGYMMEGGYGRIITASSIVGLTGNFGQTNYAATKSGVIGMTKVWAREFGRKGITANAVAPGFINTEMMATIPDQVLDTFRERTPVGRLGDPSEVANLYVFLASEEAGFINGATISIDGGLVL